MKYVGKTLYDKIDQNEHGQYHFGVSCLVLDREDYPWIGMMGPSIYRFNGKRYDNWISAPSDMVEGDCGVGDESPRPFVFDRNNHIWIPSPKGVSRFEKGAWREYDLRGLGQEYGASEVAVDSSGRIWAHGSTQESILYFAGGKLINPVCNSPIMYVSGIRVEQMTAGPANRMFFVLSYSSGDYIGVYVYEPIL